MGLIAWAIPDWRPLTLALYIPQLITIGYFWVISESVRWYMSKGRYEESEALLKEVARVNNKQLSENSLHLLRVTTENEKKKKALEEVEKADEPWLIVLVFRHKLILLRCIILPIWWITMTLVYYGLSINAVNMSGNPYINYIAVSAVEIPGFWISVLLLSRIGRKPVLMGGFWICAACQIAYIFLPDGKGSDFNTVSSVLDIICFETYRSDCLVFCSRHLRGIPDRLFNRQVQHLSGDHCHLCVHCWAVSHQVPAQSVRILLHGWKDRLHHCSSDTSYCKQDDVLEI